MVTEFDESSQAFSKQRRAAYVVGRYPIAISCWQETFEGRSTSEIVTESPQAVSLGVPFNEMPIGLFEDLYEALQQLAAEGVIKPHVLVEVYRRLDRGEAACADMVRVITECLDAPDTPMVWSGIYQMGRAIEELEAVVFGDREIAFWRALGVAIGEWLNWSQFVGLPPLDQLPKLAKSLRRFAGSSIGAASAKIIELEKVLWSLPEETTMAQFCERLSEMEGVVGEFDRWVLDQRPEHIANGPLLSIDIGQQQITFLGIQFRFADFQSGGLRCFIYLANHAGVWCSHSDIINGGELTLQPECLPQYFSRFRNRVRAASDWSEVAKECGRDARMAFILARNEKRGPGKEGQYKLAIDRSRVEIRD